MQFVSEKEIEEVKVKRQKEWEKVRRPDQPLQRPEEEYDHRTLYEKLKAQKDQKQEEWEEQFKFKNMIYKGLNDEEAVFLQTVAERQAQIDSEKKQAENEELLSYREAVEKLKDEDSLQQHRSPSTSTAQSASPTLGSSAPAKAHKSQLSLIAKAIKTKRKRSSTDDAEDKSSEPSPEKKQKVESDAVKSKEAPQHPPPPTSSSSSSSALLGLAAYSSSDSEDSGE